MQMKPDFSEKTLVLVKLARNKGFPAVFIKLQSTSEVFGKAKHVNSHLLITTECVFKFHLKFFLYLCRSQA